jgi:hypothetical protein
MMSFEHGGAEAPIDNGYLDSLVVPADEYGHMAFDAQFGRHEPIILNGTEGVVFYPERSVFSHDTGRTTFVGQFVTRALTDQGVTVNVEQPAFVEPTGLRLWESALRWARRQPPAVRLVVSKIPEEGPITAPTR